MLIPAPMASGPHLARSSSTSSASPSAAVIVSALDQLAYRLLCVFVCSLPWADNFPVSGGISLATLMGGLTIATLGLGFCGGRGMRKLTPMHGWMLAFASWATFSLIWTLDWDGTLARVGTYLQVLILAWLIWELVPAQARVQGLLVSYVFGALIASGVTVFNFFIGQTTAQLAAARGVIQWETSRYSVAGLNENDLGLMLALSIPMALYLLASRRGTVLAALCWMQLLASMSAIWLTASRGALAAALTAWLMFPLVFRRLPAAKKVASMATFLCLLGCAAYLIPATSWQRIFTFGTEISQGTLTHRTVLWAAGLESFRDHPFVGVGAGAYGASILAIVDIPLVAHNTFLSVLVELGVIGGLMLLGLLASAVYCVKHMRRLERYMWSMLLLTWTVGVFALTWEYRKPTWLLLGLLAAHAYGRRTKAV